ncbi:unnamed protein product [Phytophthora fragariaefolia]|uniref:Unnamed protein product n=1 Tax=Phytophthora fragariaefolia TaxID=1490495 RepID=A0A9W6WZI1_9STRA|nr:unnamed protein product [Phytophthora fragariaefolia]
MHTSDVVARLRLLQQDEDENLERSTDEFGAYVDYVEDEIVESESPVMDSFYLQGGNRVLKTMMNGRQPKEQDDSEGRNVHGSSRKTFRNYPYALYATDVKFQPAYRPSGQFAEQKTYFSGKYKLYGYKLECSVAYPGVAVDLSSHEPGSKSDVNLFLKRMDVHVEMLQKNVEELEIEGNGEGAAQHPIQWGVLVDKGNQGAEGVIRTIQPKRKPRGSELSHQDVARNRLVSSDRVLVENFFG